VPEHGQQHPEAHQQQRPGEDGYHGPGRLGRQADVHRVQGIAGGHGREQEDEACPHVAAGPQAGGAQRQRGGTGHDQHRVEDDRVQPGQFSGDAGIQCDLMDALVGQHEGGPSHQHHPGDDRGERGRAQARAGFGRPGLGHRGIVARLH